MNKAMRTIKVTSKDNEHERWFNDCVGQKYSAVEENGTVFKIISGKNIGCLINKSKCQVVGEIS